MKVKDAKKQTSEQSLMVSIEGTTAAGEYQCSVLDLARDDESNLKTLRRMREFTEITNIYIQFA